MFVYNSYFIYLLIILYSESFYPTKNMAAIKDKT